MERFQEVIDYYVDKLRRGDAENAFHGLLEIDREILPELIERFRATQNVGVRGFLVNVIWEYREKSVIPFLGEALHDSEPRIWRQALDGLVALACPAALDQFRAAKTRKFPKQRDAEEFRRWLNEAIDQAQTNIESV